VKYISICSGIEAATVAWHGLGWTPLAFSEIEAFPSAVLAHHYPSVPNLGDMTKYREWPEELLADCDLLVGGTPCQAFSVAGQRRSLDDERGNLSLIYVHLFHHINEVRKRHGRPPTIALWENVPGVLSTKDNAFGCFVGGLLGCDDAVETQDGKWPKAGFLGSETVRVGYRILDAQYFAVAQRRRRVFLVAVPCEFVAGAGERACPSEILSLRESVLGNPPTRGKAWERVTGSTAAGAGGGGGREVAGTLDDSYHKGCGERSGVERDVVVSCPPYARTPTQRMHKGFDGTCDSQTPIVSFHPTQDPISSVDGSTHAMGHSGSHANGGGQLGVAYAVDGGNQAASEEVHHSLRTGRDSGDAVAFKPSHYTRGKDGAPSEVTAPLSADADKGDQDTVVAVDLQNVKVGGRSDAVNVCAFAQNQLGEVRTNTDVMGTVNTNTNASGRNTPMVHQAMQVRRLTPRECEFLQGFPPDYTLVAYRNKPAANGPRYRALGNSMAVPCMAWLGWRIHKATKADNQ